MFEIRVKGIVQGVGFRPFVYKNAVKYGVVGFVQNTSFGVRIVCDKKDVVLEFLKNPPSISRVESVEVFEYDCDSSFEDFRVVVSEDVGGGVKNSEKSLEIPYDISVCDDCVCELFDEKNLRYRYFFISCTNCGPRFSIVYDTPYDRSKTCLRDFEMCSECRGEYEDVSNRRFHAQTVACSKCGPELSFYFKGEKVLCDDPIEKVVEVLNRGELVAIKGVGGFHIACRADLDSVMRLRKITGRDHKPFALMGKNISEVLKYCFVNDVEREVLLSNRRPIVLLEKKNKGELDFVSELSSLGFMLPYSPIHHLIFEKIDFPIVLTSSNMPSRPITMKLEEQFVDNVLDFNREIVNSVDDSIVKVVNGKKLLIRRSRGYALEEFEVSSHFLGCNLDLISFGSEMKNTFCMNKKDKVILSGHIGNTFNLENFEFFKQSVDRLVSFKKLDTSFVLCDMNSSFNVSLYAKEFALKNNSELFLVQHHIAHSYSVAFEHNICDFVSIVCDGVGFGDDNSVWGGEVFHNDRRVGRLEKFSLIGGDVANRDPVRVLVGILSEFMEDDEICCLLCGFDSSSIKVFLKQKEQNFNCILSSSCGRVLDSIGVLLGFCDVNYYEGRCAMLLESNSSDFSSDFSLFIEPVIEYDSSDGLYVLKIIPLFEFLVANLGKISSSDLALFSQVYIVKGLFLIAQKVSCGLPVLFSGGCAYNKIMSSFLLDSGVLVNSDVPCGDGGISLGQIAYFLWKKKRE